MPNNSSIEMKIKWSGYFKYLVTPLEYFLSGYVKSEFYKNPESIPKLRHGIILVIVEIAPELCQNVPYKV